MKRVASKEEVGTVLMVKRLLITLGGEKTSYRQSFDFSLSATYE